MKIFFTCVQVAIINPSLSLLEVHYSFLGNTGLQSELLSVSLLVMLLVYVFLGTCSELDSTAAILMVLSYSIIIVE